jgi:hypothetical protein
MESMKTTLCRLGLVVLTLLIGLSAKPLAADGKKDIHVLFIGNSLTYYHKLPHMVAELAKAGGQKPLRHEQETPGGCTFERHWKDGKAQKKIESRKWDYVILQENGQLGFKRRDSMLEYGKKLDAEIKKQGAKTILFLTWEDQHAGTQAQITKVYQDLAAECKSQIAPVGLAWEAALKVNKDLVLHEKDKNHPNKAGSYLTACVFYATLYGKSPEGLPGKIGGLTDEQARPLQVIAWKTVQMTGKQ